MTEKIHETLKNRVSQYVEQGEPSDICDNYIVSTAELAKIYPYVEFSFDWDTENLLFARLYNKEESKEFGLSDG